MNAEFVRTCTGGQAIDGSSVYAISIKLTGTTTNLNARGMFYTTEAFYGGRGSP